MVGLLVLGTAMLSSCGSATSPALGARSVPFGPHVLGLGLGAPDAITASGDHVFVADGLALTVTEFDASTGALVKVISGPSYDFNGPALCCQNGGSEGAIAADGDDLFVANGQGSLTEIDALTGDFVRLISGPASDQLNYQLSGSEAIAVAGDDLFLADDTDNSLTEFDASAGAVVRVISGRAYHLKDPGAMVVAGQDLFVANEDNSLTEIDTKTGALVRVISGRAYNLNGPDALAIAGEDLFVANESGNSLTEIDASTGAPVRVFSGPAYNLALLHGRYPMATVGQDLFVANGDNSLSEINASTGALVRVISSP